MRISCQSFSMPKAGRNFADCEDAYYPFDAKNLEIYETTPESSEIFRCSVSDGATDSIFSRLWAQLLSQGYGTGKWAAEVTAESIQDEQNAWHEFLSKQELPWYAEEKAEMGAYAATVGLTLQASNQWDALAFGDCCIFQIRNNECITAFPIDNSAGFSNFPLILCSVASRNGGVFESKRVISNGTWESGDKFLLMSDTVSCWLLAQIEAGKGAEVLESFNSLRNLNDFLTLVNNARTARGADGNALMKDDDVTVTIVTVADSTEPPFPRKLDLRAASIQQAASQPPVATTSKKNTIDLPRIPKSASTEPQVSARSDSPASSAAPPRVNAATATATDDGAYDEQNSFIGRRKFAQTTRRTGGSSGGRKGIVILLGLLLLGGGALGFSMIGAHKGNSPKPAHKVEPVQSPVIDAQPGDGKTDDNSIDDGKHHRKHHKNHKNRQAILPGANGKSSSQTAGGNTAGDIAAGDNSGSNVAPARAAGGIPPTAPDRHRIKIKDFPSETIPASPSTRSGGGNIEIPMPAPDRIVVPPQAPERMPGRAPDRTTHGGRQIGDSEGGFPRMPGMHGGHKNGNRDSAPAAEDLDARN